MGVPKVAIVGRPNVGKSSIFNWLSGRLIAVVDPTAGVTRDRVTHLMHEGDRYFELIDTGGIGIIDNDNLSEHIEHQIDVALEEADLILFVVDGQTGVLPLDQEVARRLRPLMNKPMVMVINKCDSPKTEAEQAEFYKLADLPMVTTSVKGNRHGEELRQAILKHLPPPLDTESEEGQELEQEPELKLAIVGRRNVGKSTFINALAEQERVIVSEIPGTTRDSIDIRFEMDEKTFVAIDTPGVRRKRSLESDIEFYGLVRAQKSIRRASVVLMFFDSQQTVSKVDKKLVEEIHGHSKPCIFVVNKWDLGPGADMTIDRWSDYLIKTFPSMRHVPLAFITAKESKNVKQLINLAQSIYKQARMRVKTSQLNKLLRAAVTNNPPPRRHNKRAKLYFATQVATEPPTIVIKCNDPSLFDVTWKRYLLGVFRERLPFQEVPLKVYFRPRQRDDAAEDVSIEDREFQDVAESASDFDYALDEFDEDDEFDDEDEMDET